MGTDKTRLMRQPAPLSMGAIGLEPPKKYEPGAWFLGPNGENEDRMAALLSLALSEHARARKDFWPDDPPFISDDVKKSDAYTETFDTMQKNLLALSNALRSSTPMSSYRNKSHMNWDITMPGALGYFAGMMFNSNNVAPEASPVTTSLELQAGLDLCEMLGFVQKPGTPEPWGHITCDGSIANNESTWAARNLRYQGAALARAIRLEPDMKKARDISVVTAKGDFKQLLDLEPWDLVNLPNDQILDLPRRLVKDAGLSQADVQAALDKYSLQALGMVEFHKGVLQGLSPGVVIVPATAHYSWDKGVTILGLGKQALRHISVDKDARASVPALREVLDACIAAHVPILQVVAVAGSTAESAVDPVGEVAKLRAEYASKGLSFALHADAAWGGYFTSMLRPAKGRFGITPVDPLSPYVKKHLDALKHCDTITTDPHKSGYLPYPAGALCYRDKRMIYLVAHEAPVIIHSGDAPSVGVFGMEGSKPGAAAAGVALSHTTIPLNKAGYGTLLGRCIFNAKRFYIAVCSLNKETDPFYAAPLQRLPSEKRGEPEAVVKKEREKVRSLNIRNNDDLLKKLKKDEDLEKLFQEIGPDLTVFAYAFNFIREDGTPNTDPVAMGKLNERIYKRLSVEKVKIADEPPDIPMLVTSTLLPRESYGDDFTEEFCHRAGVDVPEGALRVLISTMQDPWVTDTAGGNIIPDLMDILRETVLAARKDVIEGKV